MAFQKIANCCGKQIKYVVSRNNISSIFDFSYDSFTIDFEMFQFVILALNGLARPYVFDLLTPCDPIHHFVSLFVYRRRHR